MSLFPALLFAFALGSLEPGSPDVRVPQSTAPATITFQVAERYRFNLGGPSGEFTDWERYDLPYFDGVSATVKISKLYGKSGDKWDALARINLIGGGEGDAQKFFSLVLRVDRKTRQLRPHIWRGDDQPRLELELEPTAFDQPIEVSISRLRAGHLLVAIGENQYDIESELDVHGIATVGSGVDVLFQPFNLMRRVDSPAGVAP